MRVPRIYTEQPLGPGQEIILEPDASRHLIQVLRLRAGADLILFNGNGYNYPATIASVSKKNASITVTSCSGPEKESQLQIHLCIAVSKGERMDFAIQKAVEMGVTEITPLFSTYGVVNLKGERLQKREQHWRRVMISACEQSGRCRIPVLNQGMAIDKWFDTPQEGTCLVLDPRAETGIGSLEQPAARISILVGPEGGLSDAELGAAEAHGFRGISIGPRILRTETAPLAAIASIQTLWGDYR